jgi:hypothetical protein
MSVQAIRCSKTASGVHPTDMVSVRLKAVFNQTSEILLNMLVHRHFYYLKWCPNIHFWLVEVIV